MQMCGGFIEQFTHLELLGLLADGARPAQERRATISAGRRVQVVLPTNLLARRAAHEPAQREL
jgi:hypothetical protein